MVGPPVGDGPTLPIKKARMWISSFYIPSMGMTCHHSAAVTCTSHSHTQIRGRIQDERGQYVSQSEYFSDYTPVMAAVYVRALSSVLRSTTSSSRSSSSTSTELARMATRAGFHASAAAQHNSQPSPLCAERAAPVAAGAVAKATSLEHKMYALRPDGLAYSLDDDSEENYFMGATERPKETSDVDPEWRRKEDARKKE